MQQTANLNPDPALSPLEAGLYLSIPAKSLANMRCAGSGPDYFKIGGRVRYRKSALDRFLSDCEAA